MQVKNRLLAFTLAAILLAEHSHALAAEIQPGDTCTAGQINQSVWSAGPENSGTGNIIVCDGATWKPALRYTAGGKVSVMSALDAAVALSIGGTDAVKLPAGTTAQRPTGSAGMLRYNSTTTPADTLEYYDAESAAWTPVQATGGAVSVVFGTSASATNPYRSGDVTTGLFSPAVSTVALATAGVERLRVDANGNVGIGTASPVGIFEIVGTGGTAIFGGDHLVGMKGLVPANSGYEVGLNIAPTFDGNATSIGAGIYSQIRAKAGTTVPSGAGIYIDTPVKEAGTGAFTNDYGLYISAQNKGTTNYGIYQAGSTESNYFGGNVGIGTGSPTQKLQVLSGVYGSPATSGTAQSGGSVRIKVNDTGVLDIGELSTGGSW